MFIKITLIFDKWIMLRNHQQHLIWRNDSVKYNVTIDAVWSAEPNLSLEITSPHSQVLAYSRHCVPIKLLGQVACLHIAIQTKQLKNSLIKRQEPECKNQELRIYIFGLFFNNRSWKVRRRACKFKPQTYFQVP